MEKKDYKKYDYINVSVKEKRAEELEEMYSAFLWEQTACEEHSRYYDIYNYTFRRPKKIQNKDDLQYLQVGAEKIFNKMDKLSREKHAFSSVFGLTMGILGVALIAGGITLLCLFSTLLYIISAVLFIVAGVAVCVLGAVVARKLFIRENNRYKIVYSADERQIIEICKQAMALTESNDAE
ncbi:MAG: hypothetical protein HDP34_04740 [Clostridia bacterium]|nr:hypothetical protein [Clostridia bacterium]